MRRKEDSGEAIARNLLEMSRLNIPIICIIIGEGSSGGALAVGVGDKILMLENSIYSILSPEGFSTILWKDSSRAEEAAEIMKLTAKDLKDLKIIDKVLKEPECGAQNDIKYMSESIKKEIISNLDKLCKLDIDTLLNNRYNKFRSM